MLPKAVPKMNATVSPLSLSVNASQLVIPTIRNISAMKPTVVVNDSLASALISSGCPLM